MATSRLRVVKMGSEMPKIVSNMVDAYLFRRTRGRTHYLLLCRHSDSELGANWQSIHARVESSETAVLASLRAIRTILGVKPIAGYTADYINQFYDPATDSIVMAPVLAFELSPTAELVLDPEFADVAWCDREEATGRLLFSGQRWAIRHIEDVIILGGAEADLLRIS